MLRSVHFAQRLAQVHIDMFSFLFFGSDVYVIIKNERGELICIPKKILDIAQADIDDGDIIPSLQAHVESQFLGAALSGMQRTRGEFTPTAVGCPAAYTRLFRFIVETIVDALYPKRQDT